MTRVAMGKRTNIHCGSNFTDFLREEGIYEEVEAAAIKKVISAALAKQMERKGVSVSALAEKLGTSRAALNRVLDEDNTSITLTTLSRTAAALGCRLNL